MIKYFVRTTGERKFNYLPLEVTPLYDYNHDPINSFIEQLEIISDYDAVLLEDDLILCKNFQNEIEAAITKFPNRIINFFSEPQKYTTTHLTAGDFNYNQCTYYPKSCTKILAKQMREVMKWWPKHKKLWSQVEAEALKELGWAHVIYRPCLVQHNDISSILSPGIESRTTIWFKDYLDELGLDNDQNYSKKTVKDLTDLRDKQIFKK